MGIMRILYQVNVQYVQQAASCVMEEELKNPKINVALLIIVKNSLAS